MGHIGPPIAASIYGSSQTTRKSQRLSTLSKSVVGTQQMNLSKAFMAQVMQLRAYAINPAAAMSVSY